MFLIHFSVFTLKNQSKSEYSDLTSLNPFEYIHNWNTKYEGIQKYKLISFQNVETEYEEFESKRRSDFFNQSEGETRTPGEELQGNG